MNTRLFIPFLALLSACFVSCTTTGYDTADVSDAWLDTSPRVVQQPKRPQSTLTTWKTGLPSPAQISYIREQEKWRRQAKALQQPASRSHETAAERPLYDGYSYTVRSYWPGHYGHSGKKHRHHKPEPYVRTVEKVGPSIVPQAPVPLSTRSYSGGPSVLPGKGAAHVPTPPLRKDRNESDTSTRTRR